MANTSDLIWTSYLAKFDQIGSLRVIATYTYVLVIIPKRCLLYSIYFNFEGVVRINWYPVQLTLQDAIVIPSSPRNYYIIKF